MASYFEWEAKYNLGAPAMDDEHRPIIEGMNQLHELHVAGALGPRLLKVMQQLHRFVTLGQQLEALAQPTDATTSQDALTNLMRQMRGE